MVDRASPDEWNHSVNCDIRPKDPRRKWYHKYNIFSRAFFCWIDPLFWYGFRHTLQHKDLYSHPAEADSKYLLKTFHRYWKIETAKHKQGGNAYLWLVILKCIWWPFWIQGILSLIENFVLVPISLFLGNIIDYFCIEDPTVSETRNAYLNAFGISVMSVIYLLLILVGAFMGFKLGMITRIICATALYKKVLSLSQNTVSKLTVGHIINLSSNDIHRFDLVMVFPHYVWTCPLSVLLITYILYNEVGAVSFIAVVMVIGQIPLLIFFSKLLSSLRLKAAKVTDKRVKVMNEVITGIRVIKMYGWENAFHDLVSAIRRREMSFILRSSIIRAIYLALFVTFLPTTMFVMFSVHTALGEEITKRKIFVTLSLLTLFKIYFNFIFVFAVSQLSEAAVALKRIKKFLLINENMDPNEDDLSSASNSDHCETANAIQSYSSVSVCDLSASWNGTDDKLTLTNVSFVINQSNPLLAVVGAVGAGKSTLLQCLLGELKPVSGDINVNGTVAYAGQEPWIFSATLRENILFGQPFYPEWYKTVTDVCALEKDLDILPKNDLTVVGERGVTLSGGQKARVSLARAVYRKAGIYLLDDPLSAVDAAVSRHIFDKCIRGLLSESSIVVLVTHQLQYVQQCDTVLGLKEGCVAFCGDPNDDILKNNENLIISKDVNDHSKDLFVIRKESVTDFDKKVEFNPSLPAQHEIDEETLEYEDNFVSRIPLDAISNSGPVEKFDAVVVKYSNNKNGSAIVHMEERSEGSISYKTYHNYFKAGGGVFYTFGMFFVFILAEVAIVISDWWIASWCRWCASSSSNYYINSTIDIDTCSAGCENISNPLPVPVCISIYGVLVGSVWILAIARTVLFYIILLRASTLSHNKMFISVLRSPVLFFDTNPVGRILNRFSKDVGFLDDVLIYIFCEFLQFFTKFLGVIVTASIASYYLVILVIAMMVFFTIFRWYYLKTAREIKRLESTARSPLYSHISMTLHGLPTIRAYGQQMDSLEKFYDYQNKHTQAWYLYLVASRWFGGRIDVVSAAFVTVLAFLTVSFAESLDADVAGLALTYSLTLMGLFQYCVRQSAEVESLMVSAERVMAYGKLRSEGALESHSNHPPSNWPTKGQIEITDLSYRHSTDGPLVLQGINCCIAPGEKVGIVGRTGAGKSSMIAAFFRLAEPSGSIRIDGIECFNIGLHDLRPNISIIPQDPVLFSETVRYNLDPFNQHDDEKIWTTLKQVQLDSLIDSLDGGLGTLVSEGGSNFSVGQKQLFCLARALLKQNKILMLDEATANVDFETDSVIQQVLREQFVDCTVLTIAHRLDTVIDSDKIMVLRSGELLEYGEPHELLCNRESYLLKLVEQTGPVAAEKLKDTALLYYKRKISDINQL